MREINLRPVDYVRKKELFLPRLLIVIGIILYTAALGGFGFYLYLTEWSMESDLTVVKSEFSMIEWQLNEFRELQREIEPVKTRKEFSDNLVEFKYYWSNYLNSLYLTVPSDVVMSSVNAQDPDKITIQGRAAAAESIVYFTELINELPMFAGADYHNIRYVGEGVFSYQIFCRLDK